MSTNSPTEARLEQPAPISLEDDADKTTLLDRILPSFSITTMFLAFACSFIAVWIGVALLIVSIQHQQTALHNVSLPIQKAPMLNATLLNTAWLQLRDEILGTNQFVLPRSPSARALEWLALQQAHITSNSKLNIRERYALACLCTLLHR
jgi:hypothetical protein